MPAGPTTFGGVAWAQTRGVRAVEVRIDDGIGARPIWAQLLQRHVAVMELSLGRHPRIADDHRAGHRQHRHCADLRGGRRNSRRRHRLALGVIQGVLTARSEPRAAFGQATHNRPPELYLTVHTGWGNVEAAARVGRYRGRRPAGSRSVELLHPSWCAVAELGGLARAMADQPQLSFAATPSETRPVGSL